MGVLIMDVFRMVGAAVLSMGLGVSAASAATLVVDGSGQLTGATGVDVGGTLYDVSFQDGTCVALFSGCDEASDFTFNTSISAILASQALLDQVLVDGTTGNFDSNPELTRGITDVFGIIITPYQVLSITQIEVGIAVNINDILSDYADAGFPYNIEDDTTRYPNNTFAQWTPVPVAPIPLPAGGVLVMTGLGCILALRRRKARAA